MRAKSSADQETLTAEQWRARARYLREFTLSVLDEHIVHRMEQRAREYDQMAALADLDPRQPPAAQAHGG